MNENKKRGMYIIYNADSEIVKMYKNFKSAYKAVNKMALSGEYFELVEIVDGEAVELYCC